MQLGSSRPTVNQVQLETVRKHLAHAVQNLRQDTLHVIIIHPGIHHFHQPFLNRWQMHDAPVWRRRGFDPIKVLHHSMIWGSLHRTKHGLAMKIHKRGDWPLKSSEETCDIELLDMHRTGYPVRLQWLGWIERGGKLWYWWSYACGTVWRLEIHHESRAKQITHEWNK